MPVSTGCLPPALPAPSPACCIPTHPTPLWKVRCAPQGLFSLQLWLTSTKQTMTRLSAAVLSIFFFPLTTKRFFTPFVPLLCYLLLFSLKSRCIFSAISHGCAFSVFDRWSSVSCNSQMSGLIFVPAPIQIRFLLKLSAPFALAVIQLHCKSVGNTHTPPGFCPCSLASFSRCFWRNI